MTCARGCCATQREHYQSLVVSRSKEERAAMTQTRTDVHDHHTVDVTEHWHDRQDVTVKPPRLHIALNAREVRD